MMMEMRGGTLGGCCCSNGHFPPLTISLHRDAAQTVSFPLPKSIGSLRTTPSSAKSSGDVLITRLRSRRSGSRVNGVAGAKMSAAKLESLHAVKKKAAEMLDGLKGTSIFLVGMNCTLKTNMGKTLADALRYYYFDSDNLVEEAAAGGSAGRSFKEEDEKGFCDSETEVLKQLSSMGRLVVCAGDGSVQSTTNLSFLRYGISIWINVPLDLIAKDESPRIQDASDSDTISQVLEELSQRYSNLKGGYATADATVSLQKVASDLGYEDLSCVTPEDMTMEALKEIEKLTRVKKMMEAAARPF